MLMPEVPERTASGEIAAIYHDLRTTLGIPNVNLVFRHMATVPDCLPWAWHCLGPLYKTARIQQAGIQIATLGRNAASVPKDASFGVSNTLAAATLDSYIRANPINMLGLAILENALEAPGDDAPSAPPSASTRLTPIDQILPMQDLATAPAATMQRLRDLARVLHDEDRPVVPSLFRHFAAWPEAIQAIENVIAQLLHADRLNNIATTMVSRSRQIAASISPSQPHRPTPAIKQTIRALGDLFPKNMAKMTVVALALRKT